MQDYNFWADILTTFRSSSDLVKIVWLLMPVLSALSLVYGALKLRKCTLILPPLPPVTFQSREYGKVAVYDTKAGVELRAIDDVGNITPLLNISKDILAKAGKLHTGD